MCVSLAQALAGEVVGSDVLLIEERHTAPVQMFRDEKQTFGKRLSIMRFAGCLGISIAHLSDLQPNCCASLVYTVLVGPDIEPVLCARSYHRFRYWGRGDFCGVGVSQTPVLVW